MSKLRNFFILSSMVFVVFFSGCASSTLGRYASTDTNKETQAQMRLRMQGYEDRCRKIGTDPSKDWRAHWDCVDRLEQQDKGASQARNQPETRLDNQVQDNKKNYCISQANAAMGTTKRGEAGSAIARFSAEYNKCMADR